MLARRLPNCQGRQLHGLMCSLRLTATRWWGPTPHGQEEELIQPCTSHWSVKQACGGSGRQAALHCASVFLFSAPVHQAALLKQSWPSSCRCSSSRSPCRDTQPQREKLRQHGMIEHHNSSPPYRVRLTTLW